MLNVTTKNSALAGKRIKKTNKLKITGKSQEEAGRTMQVKKTGAAVLKKHKGENNLRDNTGE